MFGKMIVLSSQEPTSVESKEADPASTKKVLIWTLKICEMLP